MKSPDSQIISRCINEMVRPWVRFYPEGIPELRLTVIEIARRLQISPQQVITYLSKDPTPIQANGQRSYPQVTSEMLPRVRRTIERVSRPVNNGQTRKTEVVKNIPIRYPITSTRETNLKPKRIIRLSRYQSRSPNSKRVEKSGWQQKRMDGVITTQSVERAIIRFLPNGQTAGPLEIKIKKNPIEAIIYPEQKGREIRQTLNWLKDQGARKDWVFGGDETLPAKGLIDLARGVPTDILLWNCLGFYWEKKTGNIPKCELQENRVEAIALYYQEKIEQAMERLAVLVGRI